MPEITVQMMTRDVTFTVKPSKDAPKSTYKVKIVYASVEEILTEAVKSTIITIQRKIRDGLQIPRDRVVTLNSKGEPELTPQEKRANLITGLNATDARETMVLLAIKAGMVQSLPSELQALAREMQSKMSTENVPENIPENDPEDDSEDDPENEVDDEMDRIEARKNELLGRPIRRLRELAKAAGLKDFEKLTHEQLAMELAVDEVARS